MLIENSQLEKIIRKNTLLLQVLEKSEAFLKQNYYVGAGCLAQTYWNERHGFPLTHGIRDIDIIYFDPNGDIGQEQEFNLRGKTEFGAINIPVEIVNQARVHEWYHASFGIHLSPYNSLEDAVDSWPTTSTSFGARMVNGRIYFYDSFKLKDLLNLEIRPNKKLITEDIYLSKVHRWKKLWPNLKIHLW